MIHTILRNKVYKERYNRIITLFMYIPGSFHDFSAKKFKNFSLITESYQLICKLSLDSSYVLSFQDLVVSKNSPYIFANLFSHFKKEGDVEVSLYIVYLSLKIPVDLLGKKGI